MTPKTKKSLGILAILVVIGITIVAGLHIRRVQQLNKLEKEGVGVVGYVYDVKGEGQNKTVLYRFVVDGKAYTGASDEDGKLKKNNFLIIRFLRNNPSVNASNTHFLKKEEKK